MTASVADRFKMVRKDCKEDVVSGPLAFMRLGGG